MEAIGLAVGVAGLAGLFSSCLEAVQRYSSWKDAGDESRAVAARFEAEKLRLERWGESVGIDKKISSDGHHEAISDPRIESRVRDHLSIIRKICADTAETTPAEHGITEDSKQGAFGRGHVQPYRPTMFDSKRHRIKWALGNKEKYELKLTMLGQLVQDLHNLVPLDGSNGANSNRDFLDEYQQILQPLEKKQEAETRKALHTWLLGHQDANDIFDNAVKSRLGETCKWILTRPSFTEWISPEFPSDTAKLLWINGPAGFGKTVLVASIIEHLSTAIETPSVHFFFSSDFESRRDPFGAIRSWLSQLLRRTAVFNLIRERWESQDGQVATRAEVTRVFREVVHRVPQCTFIIDGLDECAKLERAWDLDDTSSISSFLNTIQQAVSNTTTRIIITSRDEPEIRRAMFRETADVRITTIEYKISPEDVYPDIELYSKSLVDSQLRNKNDNIKAEISQKLATRCHGQFLWVRLQTSELRAGRNKKQLHHAIDQAPLGLERLYNRNWDKILSFPEEEQQRAFSILRWAAFAVRPLTVSEITAAVLIDDDSVDFPVDEMPDTIDDDYIDGEILRVCGSLIEIRDSTLGPESQADVGMRTVHLTHFSVKQYLMANMPCVSGAIEANELLQLSNETVQNTQLAKACLRYVLFPSVWADVHLYMHQDVSQALKMFRDYAAGSWYQHVAAGDENDPSLLSLTNTLFDTGTDAWSSWRDWFDMSHKNEGALSDPQLAEHLQPSPLHYASRLGLTHCAKYLLRERKYGANEQSSWGTTALEIASRYGHLPVVNVLLETGADILMASMKDLTPLHSATAYGHIEMVKLLLSKGAEVNARDYGKWTPLTFASQNGNGELVKELLRAGADVNHTTDESITPLWTASAKGHLEVVKLLLEGEADPTIADTNGLTPLHLVSYLGHLEIAKMLLENGAHKDAEDINSETPLAFAALAGHIGVARLLLDRGVNINAKAKNEMTPLGVATLHKNVEICKLLLEEGVDPDAAACRYWAPLHLATISGNGDVTRLLVNVGANVNCRGHAQSTPLHFASQEEHLDIVEFLLDKGAAPGPARKNGVTPLHVAAAKGNEPILKLLLERGADIAATADNGWAALHIASTHGHRSIVELLLDEGFNVNALTDSDVPPLTRTTFGSIETASLLIQFGATPNMDEEGWSSLALASRNGHVDMVKFLIGRGADISIKDISGETLLHAASELGQIEITKVLITNGAQVDVPSHDGWTPLHKASVRGHVELVKELVSSGATLNTETRDGLTPLSIARHGHEKVVAFLLGIQKAYIRFLFRQRRFQNMPIFATKSYVAQRSRKPSLQVPWGERKFRLSPKEGFVAFCEVCVGMLRDNSIYFVCSKCDNGQFHICRNCNDSRSRWNYMGTGHKSLTKRNYWRYVRPRGDMASSPGIKGCFHRLRMCRPKNS